MVDMPKLGRTVKIKFWSLRNELGNNLGVIFDTDKVVERECRRVRTEDGWKWQIKGLNQLCKYDYYALADQEILNEYRSDITVL